MGHGHVTPNADGSLVRCGGPAICSVCALEQAQAIASVKPTNHYIERADVTVEDTGNPFDEHSWGYEIWNKGHAHAMKTQSVDYDLQTANYKLKCEKLVEALKSVIAYTDGYIDSSKKRINMECTDALREFKGEE